MRLLMRLGGNSWYVYKFFHPLIPALLTVSELLLQISTSAPLALLPPTSQKQGYAFINAVRRPFQVGINGILCPQFGITDLRWFGFRVFHHLAPSTPIFHQRRSTWINTTRRQFLVCNQFIFEVLICLTGSRWFTYLVFAFFTTGPQHPHIPTAQRMD